MSPVIVFGLNTLKGITKAPAVGPFEAEHPKRYDEQPRPFYMGVPPRGGGGVKDQI